jgi:hypothetical protein
MNRELTPKASEEPHCSNRTQEVIVREIMPTPGKKKKNTRKIKTLNSKNLTSDENMSEAMRRLFQNNDMSSQTRMTCRTSCKNSAQRKQGNTKKKQNHNKNNLLSFRRTNI